MIGEPGIDPYSEVPVYRQLSEILRAQIASGAIPLHSPLPGTRFLAEHYGIALGSVKKAVDLLRAEHLVRNVPGKGTFVVAQPKKTPRSR
jgi:GntR family transcriptional regulator